MSNTESVPKNILCVCQENTVRSSMLKALLQNYLSQIKVESAGITPAGFSNPMILDALEKYGASGFVLDEPKSIDDIEIGEFDLTIALSHGAYEVLRNSEDVKALEYWDVGQPPVLGETPPDMLKQSYALIAKELMLHLHNRFNVEILPRGIT